MTFSGMSPGYPDAVSTLPHGGQSKRGAQSAGAGDSYHPDIRRIFHPVDARKISGAIAAPVAQKGYDFGFPVCHFYIDSPLSNKIVTQFCEMLHYDESNVKQEMEPLPIIIDDAVKFWTKRSISNQKVGFKGSTFKGSPALLKRINLWRCHRRPGFIGRPPRCITPMESMFKAKSAKP